MTEVAETVAAGPQLIHAGTYALYRTPAGGLHVAFCRTSFTDPATGDIVTVALADQTDEHLPELPPVLLQMMAAEGGPPSPMAMVKALMGLRNGGADVG